MIGKNGVTASPRNTFQNWIGEFISQLPSKRKKSFQRLSNAPAVIHRKIEMLRKKFSGIIRAQGKGKLD